MHEQQPIPSKSHSHLVVKSSHHVRVLKLGRKQTCDKYVSTLIQQTCPGSIMTEELM